MKTCMYCHKDNSDNNLFCSHCGGRFEENSSPNKETPFKKEEGLEMRTVNTSPEPLEGRRQRRSNPVSVVAIPQEDPYFSKPIKKLEQNLSQIPPFLQEEKQNLNPLEGRRQRRPQSNDSVPFSQEKQLSEPLSEAKINQPQEPQEKQLSEPLSETKTNQPQEQQEEHYSNALEGRRRRRFHSIESNSTSQKEPHSESFNEAWDTLLQEKPQEILITPIPTVEQKKPREILLNPFEKKEPPKSVPPIQKQKSDEFFEKLEAEAPDQNQEAFLQESFYREQPQAIKFDELSDDEPELIEGRRQRKRQELDPVIEQMNRQKNKRIDKIEQEVGQSQEDNYDSYYENVLPMDHDTQEPEVKSAKMILIGIGAYATLIAMAYTIIFKIF